MDLEFANSPSESTWERPCVPDWSLQDLIEAEEAENSNDTSPRAEALRRAQRELYDLCRGTSPCSDLENFFEAWKDPNHPDLVQPNALLWFEVSEPYAKAFENDRVDAAQVLLAHGVKPRDPDLWAALKILEETGSKHGLEIILEAGWEIDKPTNSNPTSHNSSLLGYFVANNEDLVDWCLSLGASPNAIGPLGVTPMHGAATSGSLQILKTLIAHGGVIEGTDLVAHAATSCRWKDGRFEMIQYLLDHGVPIDAYYMGHSERWNSGSNSFYLMDGHQNALHLAISDNNRELVELLLSRGADRNLEMFSLKTQFKRLRPRELASLLGHEDIAALLQRLVVAQIGPNKALLPPNEL